MTGMEPSTAMATERPAPAIRQGVPRRRRRPWRAKFKDAFRGLKLGIRGHSSFCVHFFSSVLVLAAGLILRCAVLEWCALIGCIGLVLTAELFNSAVETLVHGLDGFGIAALRKPRLAFREREPALIDPGADIPD